MKKCTKCLNSKNLEAFYRDRRGLNGYRSVCKECDKSKASLWNKSNSQAHAKHQKKWRETNRQRSRDQRKKYVSENPQDVLASQRKYYKNNINARLARALRIRLNAAIKNNQKSGSAVSQLGCSIEELRRYLESKFLPGMTWDNWGHGKNKWHIDHIKPLSSFNLSDMNQFLEANNYRNLQPLWSQDNLIKGAKDENFVLR